MRSLLWFAAAYVTLAVAAGVGKTLDRPHEPAVGSIGYIAVVALMYGGLRMIGTGRRHWVSSADRVTGQDRRPPVLYLRSFHDDDLLSRQRGHWRTHEELWVKELRRVGPVVALGAPGRELPHLGAARRYETEAGWREAILQWMRDASLVVLFLGDTEAFSWEVERSVEIVPPERLVFLLPSDPARWPAFRDHFQARSRAHLPAALPGRTVRLRAVLPARFRYPTWGVLYFDPDWTPHLSKCWRPKVTYLVSLVAFGALSRESIYRAMEPVFERQDAPRPGVSVWGKLVRAYLATFLAFAVLVLLVALVIVVVALVSRAL